MTSYYVKIMKILKTLVLCAWLLALFIQTKAQTNANNTPGDSYLKFSIKDILPQQKHTGKDSITFLSENTMTGKLIRIKKNHKFTDISEYDLIYYIFDGKGKFKTGNTSVTINKGSVVFVPRNTYSSFYEVTVPMDAIELVSLEDKSKGDSLSASFSIDQLKAAKLPGKNVFDIFLKRKSMLSGFYMLPKQLKGDTAVYMHRFDEVNLVTNGSGKLIVGKDNIPVKPGDIIYVKRGTGHSFNSLKQNMDILIFFEMKSVQE